MTHLRRRAVDLKNEAMQDAYPELWRLVTHRPVQSPAWRNFWKVWLIAFVPMMVALAVTGEAVFTVTGVLVLAGGVALAKVATVVLRRIGRLDEPDTSEARR